MIDLNTFTEQMPKAELHVHIEGTLEPEMMLALAARNRVTLPYGSIEDVRAAYRFTNLQDFLDLYYQGMSVLRTERDFRELAWAYLGRAHAENVKHVEIFFDPQGHTARGVAFETVLDGLSAALAQAERRFAMTSRLIMCILRHLPEQDAFETLDCALAHRSRIHGIGLDSSELGHPPSKFERVFARARAEGFTAVAHAGEEGPPAYVREALDLLAVARIDHGNRAMEEAALVERLAASGMALTVCPLSNLRLCVVEDLREHPLGRMLESGLCATVNSDDPAYFGGYVNDNYRAISAALGLSLTDVQTLARNSFIGSFMSQADKERALADFDAFASDFSRRT
ncbi:MAG: adenosine deaminase [Gammaproteobacteria bacterium]